ncbi:MobA/MobL family protein, partial [Listeria booriae]|uniref:MobQ family relaxase n=1 Tax=Listeria booriae TaxID=1552123 RepID=UPI0016232EEF
MAIYHLSMKIGSRSDGQNAVASAAYRSGDKLLEQTEDTFKFYARDVQPENTILAPSYSPSWVYNREELWNAVEKSEKRADSQLFRELEIALPRELDYEEQKSLIKDFIQDICVDKGMIADIAVHRDNPLNPHAHVMLTTREITPDGFALKNREWNKKNFLAETREQWASYTNKVLEKSNVVDFIDHRSHADRGLETIPTKHLGVEANQMERRGIKTEIGDYNRKAKEYNDKIISLQKRREELAKKNFDKIIQKQPITGVGTAVVPVQSFEINHKKLLIAFKNMKRSESEKHAP